jgi:hypothetical protein
MIRHPGFRRDDEDVMLCRSLIHPQPTSTSRTHPMCKTFALLLALAIAPAVAAEPRVYGDAMPDGEARPIAAALTEIEALAGRPAKFAGRIVQVCQNKGCWLILEDEGRHARVKTRDHAFFVPPDAPGRAVVYGVLAEVELKPEMARHLAEDAGASEPVPTREFQIVADAVALLD